MKRAEDREKPGRKELYARPVSVSLYLPSALLERVQAADIPAETPAAVRSRNARLIWLLESALDALETVRIIP